MNDHGLLLVLLGFAGGIALLAAAGPERSEPSLQATAPTSQVAMAAEGNWHVVEAGEDLRDIARHYYGSPRQWRALQVANGVTMRPDPGTELWIPSRIDVWSRLEP